MTYTAPYTPPPEHDPKPGWGQRLGNGAAGTALLHIAYARTGHADWATAHQWVTAMTRNPVAAHPDASLYRGAPAVAFVLRTAGLSAYRSALADLDTHIAAITRTRLEQAHERIDRGQLPELREFDLINGLTGLGVYLLHAARADPHHTGGPLRDVLTYLVRLARPITIDDATLPGWWTTTGPSGTPDPRWPGGHANLGMAHGIAGPLALLSAAMTADIAVSGQADAIERLEGTLDAWRRGSNDRPWWPGLISAREWTTGALDATGPQRPSWCYGTPGLAHALQLAAHAMTSPARAASARTALIACIIDNAQLGQLGDDTLCHGWAGLVHTARRMLNDTDPSGEAASALARLEYRWRQRRTHTPRDIHTAGELSDPGGMLEGSTGIALTDLPPEIGWDACLLTTPPTTTSTATPAATRTEGPG